MFERYKNRKSLLLGKKSANELLLDVDTEGIDDDGDSFGEYFTYRGVKVFINNKAYSLYNKYLGNIGE